MSNANRKERRAASWRRGRRLKEEQKKAQAEREAANKALRKAGEPTPWERARADRAGRRRSEGKKAADV